MILHDALSEVRILLNNFFFFWFSAFSQEIRVQGSLRLKNDNSPLFGVNVIAKNPKDSTSLAYAISNDKGEFSLC